MSDAQASLNTNRSWSNMVTVGQSVTCFMNVTGATPNSILTITNTGPNTDTLKRRMEMVMHLGMHIEQ